MTSSSKASLATIAIVLFCSAFLYLTFKYESFGWAVGLIIITMLIIFMVAVIWYAIKSKLD